MSVIETKPLIGTKIFEELKSQVVEEKQVILHCCFEGDMDFEGLIRIWRTSFLIDRHSAHLSKLIHFENISLYPHWTVVPPGKDYWFTLVFSGLPASCTLFDFIEFIPQSGGFLVENIPRNLTDIYRIKI